VKDKLAPKINDCVADIVASAGRDCKAVVNWEPPAATDDCSPIRRSSTHEPGGLFDIGTTKVVYTFSDTSGNTLTCNFNIVVNDLTPPELSGCLEDVRLEANGNCKAIATWTPPALIDNCTGTLLTSTHNPGEVFSLGTTTVVYTGSDAAGNQVNCSFDVIVTDGTGPIFSNCPTDIFVAADESCQAIASWNTPHLSDNCSDFTLTSSHNPGDLFNGGRTEVVYKATDHVGNISECHFNVFVSDEKPPTLQQCPVNIFAKTDNADQISVTWVPPTAFASCGEVLLESTHEPGAIFVLGTTRVDYTARSLNGETTSCSFDVVISYEEILFDAGKILTPDGNGENDVWILTNIEKYSDNNVLIVDRWGSVIFNESGYNNENITWRGENKNGVLVPTGTYFYTISVKRGPAVVEKRGFIEVIN
jgi:gliding motility-associated-like protein